MADFDAQLPVRALATEFTTEVANSIGATINPAEDWAQGSTTSGQNGVLDQGAVTTAAPTYTTGTTNPLSLTTVGNLRVDGSSVTQPVSGTVTANQGTPNATPWNENIAQYGGTATSLGQKVSASSVPVVIASDQSAVPVTFASPTSVLTYFTDAAVASGATTTHSVAGPINLDKVSASGSGEIKLTVAIGTTGSEVTYWNSFTSASDQNTQMDFEGRAYIIPSGQSVKVTLKNRDTAAQDLYVTFFTH
jgi:hypothetical protein